jgi:hypothetical protein
MFEERGLPDRRFALEDEYSAAGRPGVLQQALEEGGLPSAADQHRAGPATRAGRWAQQPSQFLWPHYTIMGQGRTSRRS